MSHTSTRLAVGMPAPDFDVVEAGGRHRSLSDVLGQPAVLAFYPSAWDPSRADQLAHFNRLVEQVPGVRAELVGISRNGDWCALDFGAEEIRVPVLTGLDPDGAVAEQFGVPGEQAVFVLDAGGIVRWMHAGPAGTAPSSRELVEALAALTPTELPTFARDAEDEAAGAIAPCLRPRRATEGALLANRREFITTALAASFALAVAPLVARAEQVTQRMPLMDAPPVAPAAVTLHVNGRSLALSLEPRVTLLDALREYAGLTGTKKGCDHGQCGACTVHVNGRRELSCLSFAIMHQGDEITTVEGLAQGEVLHPMQAAFIQHDGFQCGYCTSGQIMSATALLKEPCGTADADVRECMSGNICRCGAYPGIVAAIQQVRQGRA